MSKQIDKSTQAWLKEIGADSPDFAARLKDSLSTRVDIERALNSSLRDKINGSDGGRHLDPKGTFYLMLQLERSNATIDEIERTVKTVRELENKIVSEKEE